MRASRTSSVDLSKRRWGLAPNSLKLSVSLSSQSQLPILGPLENPIRLLHIFSKWENLKKIGHPKLKIFLPPN